MLFLIFLCGGQIRGALPISASTDDVLVSWWSAPLSGAKHKFTALSPLLREEEVLQCCTVQHRGAEWQKQTVLILVPTCWTWSYHNWCAAVSLRASDTARWCDADADGDSLLLSADAIISNCSATACAAFYFN